MDAFDENEDERIEICEVSFTLWSACHEKKSDNSSIEKRYMDSFLCEDYECGDAVAPPPVI